MTMKRFTACLLSAGLLLASVAPVCAKPVAVASKAAKVDINSASPGELEALPGIGKAYTKAIVANRPYTSIRQLVSRKVLPQGVYDKVKDRMIAKHL